MYWLHIYAWFPGSKNGFICSLIIFDNLHYLFENACCQPLTIHQYRHQSDEYRHELSSGPFRLSVSIFTSNLAAEYEPCPRTVNSAMKANIVIEKKKPGIMALYPEGIANLQD